MRAWRDYMDGNPRLMDVLNRDLQERHDLSLAEYRILVLLSESQDGSLRMSELADGVLSSRSRLTHQIRRMEEQGLVRATPASRTAAGFSPSSPMKVAAGSPKRRPLMSPASATTSSICSPSRR